MHGIRQIMRWLLTVMQMRYRLEKTEGTASREIPAGIISPRKALWFIAINTFLFVLTTASIKSH